MRDGHVINIGIGGGARLSMCEEMYFDLPLDRENFELTSSESSEEDEACNACANNGKAEKKKHTGWKSWFLGSGHKSKRSESESESDEWHKLVNKNKASPHERVDKIWRSKKNLLKKAIMPSKGLGFGSCLAGSCRVSPSAQLPINAAAAAAAGLSHVESAVKEAIAHCKLSQALL